MSKSTFFSLQPKEHCVAVRVEPGGQIYTASDIYVNRKARPSTAD
jgi:hypothetical protein